MRQQQSVETIREATRLTREGKLAEATALLQGGISSGAQPGAAQPAFQPLRLDLLHQHFGAHQGGLPGSLGLKDLLSRLRQKGAVATPGEPEPQLPGRWLD